MEIYNEKVRDLLTDFEPGRLLRVREHPHTGPYIDGEKFTHLQDFYCHLRLNVTLTLVGPYVAGEQLSSATLKVFTVNFISL